MPWAVSLWHKATSTVNKSGGEKERYKPSVLGEPAQDSGRLRRGEVRTEGDSETAGDYLQQTGHAIDGLVSVSLLGGLAQTGPGKHIRTICCVKNRIIFHLASLMATGIWLRREYIW